MTAYDFTVQSIDGTPTDLSAYKGKVCLVVNLASKCGLTPQYAGLAELYNKYEGRDFAVLGFPCNQFGKQEPGTNAQVKDFACGKGAKFFLGAKVDVNGPKAEPLYDFLRKEQGGGTDISWNFEKFLVDKDGMVVKRYSPRTEPKELEGDIEKLL